MNTLRNSKEWTQTLRKVSLLIDKLEDRRKQSNIAAATSLLAVLVLNKDVIKQVLWEEIMQESVIYQDIKEQGIKQGLQKGQAILVLRQLKRRIGEVESGDETRITGLSVEQLEALGEALLDFSSRDDLEPHKKRQQVNPKWLKFSKLRDLRRNRIRRAF